VVAGPNPSTLSHIKTTSFEMVFIWLQLPYILRTKYYKAVMSIAKEVETAKRFLEPEMSGQQLIGSF
jgi:hypothetical protein